MCVCVCVWGGGGGGVESYIYSLAWICAVVKGKVLKGFFMG